MELYYARKKLVHKIKAALGKQYIPRRYEPMYADLALHRPLKVLEIGTNDGLNAARMIKVLRGAGAVPQYYGFDLFGSMDERSHAREFSLKVPSRDRVATYLKSSGAGSVQLIEEDTTKTLPAANMPTMDFIFIDGGHSEDTVRADWNNCQSLMHGQTIVYFDDYPNWGIRPVVDEIDRDRFEVKIMEAEDEFPDMFSPGREMLKFRLARVNVKPGKLR